MSVAPRIGGVYDDPGSPGRQVKVLAVDEARLQVTVETVRAAEAAVTAHAVGKQTVVSVKTFRRFKPVSN